MPIAADKSFIVDFTNVKDQSGFNPVHQPAGDYHGIVKDVSDGKSKQDNATVTFAIADVDRPSAVYRYVCTFTEASLWKLRNLLVAAGMNAPKKKLKLSAASLNKLIGKEIGMTLEDNEYEGKTNSQIVGVFPADDLPADEDDTPPVATKKGKAKPAAAEAEDDEEEDLEELDIDDL